MDWGHISFTHLPREGGLLDQSMRLLGLMEVAWRAWIVWGHKPQNEMKWDENDAAFISWALNDE